MTIIASPENSTTTPLAKDGIFEGQWIDGYAASLLSIDIATDKYGYLYIDLSDDKTAIDYKRPTLVNTSYSIDVIPNRRYFKIRYLCLQAGSALLTIATEYTATTSGGSFSGTLDDVPDGTTYKRTTSTEKGKIHSQNTDTGTNATDFSIGGNNAIKEGDTRLIDSRTPTAHTHAQSEIVDLGTTLSGKVDKVTGSSLVADSEISKIHSNTLDHTQGTDQGLDTGGENAVTAAQAKAAYTHSGTAHAPSNAQKNSDITKDEIEAKLTGEISSHTHASSGGLTQQQVMRLI
jgi:hypothetical protein